MKMKISVVVPTFNGAGELPGLLEGLARQRGVAPLEIVAIDSGSTDGTRECVEKFGARFVPLNAKYNHGLARDAGIAATSGDLIFLTVQDAVPQSDECLSLLARHFEEAKVAGVSTRQIPPEDGPAELKIKAEIDLKKSAPVTLISLADHPDYASYSPEERVELYRFDNVGAMLRRSVWEKIPFGPCEYAEDLLWARRALEAGHTIVRDFTTPMIHAHRRSFVYEFRRGLLDARVMDEQFGFRYRLVKKLNRVKMLAAGGGGGKSGRGEAFKTYSAHALSRVFYGTYATVLKPLGIGNGVMRRWTGGI